MRLLEGKGRKRKGVIIWLVKMPREAFTLFIIGTNNDFNHERKRKEHYVFGGLKRLDNLLFYAPSPGSRKGGKGRKGKVLLLL